MLTRTLLASPPCVNASDSDLYESFTCMYLPTTAMRTSLSGFFTHTVQFVPVGFPVVGSIPVTLGNRYAPS